MRISRSILPLVGIIFIVLQGCAPTTAAVQEAIAKTQAAYTPTPKALTLEQKYAKNIQDSAQAKLDNFVSLQEQWTSLMDTSEKFDTFDPVGSYAEYIKYVFAMASLPNINNDTYKMMNKILRDKNTSRVACQ